MSPLAALGDIGIPFEEIDLSRLERVLGTDDDQSALLDEVLEYLRSVPIAPTR